MTIEDNMKRTQEIENAARKMAIALVKKFAGIDFADPATKGKDVKFSIEARASCLMAASILYARLGASFDTPPDGLIGGMMMALQEAYPGYNLGFKLVGQDDEREDTGFLHFNKKPIEC